MRQAHFIEVEVDTETGEIDITKMVCVNDVGKAVNPDAVEGQQYGGAFMGAVGMSRDEEKVCDPQTGVWLNANLIGYSLATILDGSPVDCHIVETGLGYGPYGLGGVAENIGAAMVAITGDAVYNAIGKWVDDYPTTPARVLKALGKI